MKKTLIGKLLFVLALFVLALLTATKVSADELEPVAEEPVAEEPVADDLSGWEKFVNEFLSADKVAMYMSWLAYIGTIIGLVASLKKLKNANNLTLKNVSDEVQDTLQKNISENVKEQVERFLPNVINTQEKTNDILKIFSKVLALGQENTPESRVAILNCIEELGTTGKDVVDNAKNVIKEEVKAIEEHKENIDNRLDKIIQEYDGTSI